MKNGHSKFQTAHLINGAVRLDVSLINQAWQMEPVGQYMLVYIWPDGSIKQNKVKQKTTLVLSSKEYTFKAVKTSF